MVQNSWVAKEVGIPIRGRIREDIELLEKEQQLEAFALHEGVMRMRSLLEENQASQE